MRRGLARPASLRLEWPGSRVRFGRRPGRCPDREAARRRCTMLRWVKATGFALGVCATTACAGNEGDDDDVLRAQLSPDGVAVDYDPVDAVEGGDAVREGEDVVAAEAIPGVDGAEYETVTVEGELAVTRVLDARTRRVVDETRERVDRTRRDDADRLRR